MPDPIKEKILPYWSNTIPENSFISYQYTFDTRKNLRYFDQDSYGGMKYYFYDPTKYGYEKNKQYPLIIFIHGQNNAMHGDECIFQCGAAYFATEEYQKRIGGAYILIPVANEKMKGNETINSWDTPYIPIFYSIINNFIQKYTKINGGINSKVLIGSSSGAHMLFKLSDAYPKFFNILVAVASSTIPTNKEVREYNKNGTILFFFISKHDEYIDYETVIKPRISIINDIEKHFLLTPEWVYYGDKGIASNYYNGIEMGQHCTIIQIQYDLLFDDGTPMFEELPKGFLFWLKTQIYGE